MYLENCNFRVTQFSKYFSSICQRFDSNKTLSSLRRRNVDEIQLDNGYKKKERKIFGIENDIK